MTTRFVRQRLTDAAFPPLVADAYRSLLRDAHQALDEGEVPSSERRVWIVPGRIEVLGKHVDYAGGRSLLCTVERGIVIVARRRDDRQVVLRDARRREAMALSLDSTARGSIPWAIYPRTVINRLVRNFGASMQGADVALASNLPPAAGVSSSSALTVGLTLAFTALNALDTHPLFQEALPDRAALAGYVGALENGMNFGVLTGEKGVGTMGGAQDQTAILCSERTRLEQFSWAPVHFERTVTWPATHTFVVGVSGVVAAKTGAAKERYNRAARTAHRLVAAWNATTTTPVHTLRDAFFAATGDEPLVEIPDSLRAAAERAADAEFSAGHLVGRLGQFFDETFVIVPQAADALQREDFTEFGRLVDKSQAGAERALENQIAETVHLQRYARELGATAASAFGAGFGGAVWAMVPTVDAERFAAKWRERYLRVHHSASHRSLFFTTSPSPPAFELLDD
ncbi:galactokinase family protein [Gemmatimonas phototrophica]|uniref:galactokinase family protein n=1 Tax=Gemmatimonas phototrophica TaxID=1379270 RepID=UPI0006A70BE7|nr:galactokinase family protein [Gemmatimonas phototrophica]